MNKWVDWIRNIGNHYTGKLRYSRQNSYSSEPHRARGDFTHAVTIRPSDGATDGLTGRVESKFKLVRSSRVGRVSER